MLEILQAEDVNQQVLVTSAAAIPTFHRIVELNIRLSSEKEAIVFTSRKICNKEQTLEETEEERIRRERDALTKKLTRMNAKKRALVQRKITHTKKEMRTDAQLLILDILEREKLKKKCGRQPRKRKKEAI